MGMTLKQKQAIAADLSVRLDAAKTVYLTDFTGLEVVAVSELRTRLRKEGAEYRIVKNTLARRAMEGLDLPGLSEFLVGPTGLVLTDGDPAVPARVIKEFAKEHDDRPVLKVGVVDRRTVSAGEVGRLADLPSREALLGAIAGSLTAGVAGIAGVMDGLIRDIAHMVEEVARKQEAQ